MIKKLFLGATLTLQVVGFCAAQTTPPSLPASNPHKAYDDKYRACKMQAAAQNLTGEARRAFIAQCVKAVP
jgi:hypothetical protein